jgi:hypothetical protein
MVDTQLIAYIEARQIPEPNSGCWLWLGPSANRGYGQARLADMRTSAHRASYIAYRGPVPDDMDVDHLCRNPACVNPDHLEAVTHQENCRRRSAHIDLCKRGHTYDYVDARGHRRCHQCDAIASRKYRGKGK